MLPIHRLQPMDGGWARLASFTLIKCLDGDGDGGVVWSFRTSEPFDVGELLGALVVQTALERSWSGSGRTTTRTSSEFPPRRGDRRAEYELLRQPPTVVL